MKSKFVKIHYLKVCSVITAACLLLTATGSSLSAYGAYQTDSPYNDIFDSMNVIRQEYGKVTSVSDNSSDITVVNIQDLHCHEQTQRNISEIIKTLDKNYSLKSVFIEGGYGQIDVSWINKIQDEKIKSAVIEKMLQDGYLTGAEYYAIKNSRYDLLKGIEEKDIHQANLNRLSKIMEKQPEYDSVISKINKETEVLSGIYLNERNKRFTRKINEYESGKTDTLKFYRLLHKYVEKICQSPGQYNNITAINMQDYPNISKYLNISSMSKDINPRQVGIELQALINVVKNKIPYGSYQRLLSVTNNFNDTGKLAEFLIKFCEQNEIDLSKDFKELDKFFEVSRLNQRINPLELVNEEKILVDQIRMALSYDDTEYEISYINDFAKYFNDYFKYALTSADWKYVRQNFDKFRTLYAKYAVVDRIKDISSDIDFINQYYDTNDYRNNIFTANILNGETPLQTSGSLRTSEQVLKQSKEVIVVIAGGYHSQDLESIFSEKKVNDIVITPNVTDDIKSANKRYDGIIKEQASMQSSALAFRLASCLPDEEQRNLMARVAVEIYGKENIDQIRKLAGNDFDISKIETAEFDEQKKSAVKDLIQATVSALVSSLPLNAGKDIFNPDIDDILTKMSLKLYDMGFYFENGPVYEIDSSEYKDKDLLGIPAETYSRMFSVLQKSLLAAQRLRDEEKFDIEKGQNRIVPLQQQTALPDSQKNGEEYTSVTLSENEDSPNSVDEESDQKSIVYDERFDNLLKYINKLGGKVPVIGSSESAVYRRQIQTAYSIMVKEIDLNYMQQVYEGNDEVQGIIKYLQMLRLKNLKDRESLISIVRNSRLDIKYRLTAFMYLKMEGYDDSEYEEILKNDFLINLKTNSLDIKNNFDLSAMGAGVMLVLSVYLRGKGYINATREKEIYERISESVFLAKSKWNNTEANAGMFFTTPNPLTIAHEIGHRVLMFYADITKGSSYSTAHEIFADIIAYVFAEKAGIEGKAVFDSLYELYNPKMNYDYVMQEEHRAAVGLIYLVKDIAKRMGKQVKLDFLADAIISRIVSVEKLPQRQPDAIKEFISEYENILKEKGIYNSSEIEQFESILRQETWKTKVFELFALLRNSNGTRWDYYGETYGNIINRIRVEVAEPESYKFGAVLADYSNDLVVVNNIIMSQPDKIDAVLEIVKQELSKNEYLFRSQIAKIIFADLMISVPQMKNLTKNQIDMIIQHAVDEYFSTKTEYAVSEIDYSKIRKDALFEYALIEAVSSYGNGKHGLKTVGGGYFKNGYYVQDMRTDKYFKYSESLPHFVPTIDTFFMYTGIIKIYRKFFDFIARKRAESKEYRFRRDINFLTILRDSNNRKPLEKILYNKNTDIRYKLFALMYLKKNGVNDIDDNIIDGIKKEIVYMFHTGRMQVRNNFELRAVLTGVCLLLEDFSKQYINENKETELYKAISEAIVLRRGKEDIGARANFAFVSVDPLSMAHELGHRILSSSFEGGFKEITIHELFAETVSNLFAQIVSLEGRGYRSSLYGLFNSEVNYEDVFQEEHRAAIGFIELIKDISGSISRNIRWETLADAVIKYVSASALDIAETDQGINLKNIFIEYLKQLNNKKQYTKDDLRLMFNMAHTVTKGEIVVIEILNDIKRANPVQYEKILEVIKTKIKPQTSYMKKLFGKKLKYTGDDEVLARLIFSQPKNIQPVLRIIRAEILKTGNYDKYDFTNLIKLEFLIRNPNKIYSSKKELDKDTYRMAEYIIKFVANDAYHGVYKTFNYTDYQYVQSYMNGTSGGQNGIDSYFRDSSRRMTMTWLDNLLLSFGKTDFNERQKIVAAVEYPIIVLGMFFPKIRNWFLSKHKTGDISQIEVRLTKLEETTAEIIKNVLKIEISDISSLSFIKKLAILSKILTNKIIKTFNIEEHLKLNEALSKNQKLPAKTESMKWILILSISVSLLITVVFHFHFISFVFMIFPVTSFVTLCWSLLKPQSDKIYGKEKYESEYFSNIPETDYDYSQGPTASVTVQIPVFKEDNNVIFNTIMQSIKACEKYAQKSGARANIVISDDGLAVLLNGDISKGNIENLLRKDAGKLTKAQRQAIERIKFYRANNISFVARPEKHRKGFFKKASNLNHTYGVIKSLENAGIIDDGTYYEGDSLFIGDIILLLDKDSQLHEDVISVTIPKFIKDDKLAFTQNSTLPSNESDNYFTRFLAPFTAFLFQHIFSANAISGGLVPFVGHNGFIRKKCLEEIKNWPENRVSEDFYTSIKFQTRGYRGMYLSFKGYEFKEMVSRSFIEESNKILRYAFGLLELIFNRHLINKNNGIQKGVLTDWMKDFLKSENIKWYQKINFFIYPLSYVNLISVIPMTLISLFFKKIIISQFSLLFLIFTIPFVLVMYKIYKENNLPNQTKDSDINIIFKILLNIVSISVMFISFSYSVLKGLWKFISPKKPEFPATNIDEENYNLKQAFDEMKQHFNKNKSAFLFLIPWLLITFAVKPVVNAAFIASLFYITAFPFASVVLSPFLLKAVKQAFNAKIQNIRLNFRIYDELNLFADKIPDENTKELNIFIVNDLTKFEHKYEFINTGIKVNGKTIWQINIDGMLVFGAKDVNIQEIAQALNGSKILEKKIKKILQLNKKVRLDIDSVIVDEQSDEMFFYGRTAVINTNQYTKTVAKILDSISVMYAQKTIISLVNISDNDLYSALSNGALRKVITVAQFEYLKKEFEKSGKDILREILELRKRGIEIYISGEAVDEQYKDFGISGQIIDSAVYDYYSRETFEIELIKEKIPLQQLENKIINSDKPLVIEINLLKEIFRTTKDIIETYNGLQSLIGSIKIKFGLKDIKIKDIESFAYSIDFSDLPAVREDEIMINAGIDNFCDIIGLEKDNIIRIILEDTKISEDVKRVFFNIIKERILAKTKLSESNKPNGLKDKKMEILLGKLLFLRYRNADKTTLLPEIDSFKGSESDMQRKINELYGRFAADNDPRIINTMIELIVIYCEEYGDKEIQEMNDINRTDSYRKMLAAA